LTRGWCNLVHGNFERAQLANPSSWSTFLFVVVQGLYRALVLALRRSPSLAEVASDAVINVLAFLVVWMPIIARNFELATWRV
jgi:hypothetical protein